MKKAFSMFFAFVLVVSLGVCNAFATEGDTSFAYGSEYFDFSSDTVEKQIADDADLLTQEQENILFEKIEEIKKAYQFDVVLHTTNSIGDKSIVEYADDYYDYNGYGVGDERDGLLFMLNMNNGEEGNRDYYTSTCGYGLVAFTDYAISGSEGAINSQILPYLIDGDYYMAFSEYLGYVDEYLYQAKQSGAEAYKGDDGVYYGEENEYGGAYDFNNPYEPAPEAYDYIIREVILFVAAIVIAIIVSLKLKGAMKTNVKKPEASDYVVQGSLNVTNRSDVFVRKSVSRTAVPKSNPNTSSSGGGSSSHTSSSGTTHGGGGGKF